MIYILHGEDIFYSHQRIRSLLAKNRDFERIWLDEKSSYEDFAMASLSQTILDTPKIIICENFLRSKKVSVKEINLIVNTANILVFWEKTKLNPQKLKKINSKIFIEEFKVPSIIFNFLDSISQGKYAALKNLVILEEKNQSMILWQLTNRVYLILLAKLGLSKNFVASITGKTLQDWQWFKIESQAQKFEKDNLYKILNGLLKIDYFVKSGRTNLEDKPLISMLFLKYLT